MSFLESTLQAALLEAAPRELPNVRFFRRNVGRVKLAGGRVVQFGVPGQCDLQGVVRGTGVAIEVELKAATGSASAEQKAWAAWCASWGVAHIVLKAKKDESVAQTVARWIEELKVLVGG